MSVSPTFLKIMTFNKQKGKNMKKLLFLSSLCYLLSAPVCAEESYKILGEFNKWKAIKAETTEGTVCFMSAEPTKSAGKYSKRDDIFLFITHRPKDKEFNVINTVAGYTYKKGSKPTLRIDNKNAVILKVLGDTAWTENTETDQALIAQMKPGSNAVLSGTSARGTKTTDTFSLKGFTKAYESISKACGYKK